MFIKHSKQIIVKNLNIDLDCLSNLLPQTTINWNLEIRQKITRLDNNKVNFRMHPL